MANFLDNLTEYNAKAAVAISQAVADGDSDKANMMSSLKTTANDTALSDAIRLNALTALINLGGLLDIPLPPYYPIVATYENTQTYVGDHNSLSGIQGGAPGEYYHLTSAELAQALNAASVGDINFSNLGGVYSDNASLNNALLGKQNVLSGTGFVKISGTTISYDNSTYLTSTTLNATALTGELTGTFGNAAVSNAAVINKVLTGWNGSVSPATVTSSDTIISALQKLNANINDVVVNPSGVSTVALTNNATGIFTTTSTPASGAVTLNLGLNTQSGNLILASPNSTSGQPTFRSLVANDLPNSGASAGSYGSTTTIPVITVDAKGRITSVSNVTAASGGQVNTITLAVPSFLGASSVNNTNPASPQIVLQLSTQTANTVFAGPTTGSAAAPTFRVLVEDDIPSLDPSKITGLSALLSTYLTGNLSDGAIWIGNTSNAATPRFLSGDVTVSNTGVTTIGASKVQYSMIQDVTAQTLLGRYELTNGVVQQVTLSGDFVLDDITGVLSLSSPVAPVVTTKGDLLSFNTTQDRLPSSNVDGDVLMVYNTASNGFGLQWNTINGDVSVTDASTGEITIGNSAVTLAKMADLPAYRVIGNDTAGTLAPKALTKAELTTLVNQFTSSLPGVVPASGGGTTNFLRADGSWSPVSGGGTTTNTLSNGTGIASFSFDGSIPGVTVGIDNTVVATLTDTQSLTNKSLGAGTVIDVATPDAGTIWYSSDTAGTVAPLNATGFGGKYLRLNPITELPEWAGVSGGIAIGDTITGATAGSVLFAGTSGVLAQENGDFFWDNTNKFLGIGTTTPECGLHVVTSGSSNIKGIMNMHFDNTAMNQAKFIGARARGSKNSPSAIQTDDAITSLSGRGYKATAWSNTVGGFYIFASQNWTDSITGTYLTFRGVANGGTTVTEWGRLSNNGTTTTFNVGATSALALTTAATTASIFNTTATTLNIGGAATTVNLGGGSGCAINLGGGTNAAELRFLEPSAGGTSYTALKAPSLAASYTLTLPNTAPGSGQVMVSDGSGNLSWSSNPGTTGAKYISTNAVGTVVGTIAETVVQQLLIPANTFSTGDGLKILFRATRTLASTTVRWKFYVSDTSNTFTGKPQMGFVEYPNNAATSLFSERNIFISSSTVSYYINNPGTSRNTDFNSDNYSTSNINWTVDQYIILTVINGNTTQSVSSVGISVSPT